jgi:hypothetical protein
MITAKQLRERGIGSWDGIEFIFKDCEYSFDTIKQELYFINDGFGEPEFIAKVTDIDELFSMLELL